MLVKRIGIITGLTAGLIMLAGISASAADQQSRAISVYYPSMHFVFDGKELAPPEEQSGFIYEGSTYVPLRFISYALNKGVEWNSDTYTVSVAVPSVQQKVEIQDYRLNREVGQSSNGPKEVSTPEPKQINAYFEKIQYLFDNQPKQPSDDLPGLIYENTLYVPMRFFSESIGKQIDWDPVTYTVSAASSAPAQPPVSKPETKPEPTKPPVTPSPIGGGGGVVSKPSYDSLKSSADASISALRDEAQGYFLDLLLAYSSADAARKAAIRSEGAAKLSGFDSRFESILGDFQSKLIANGYNTDIIGTYRQEYQAQKAAAQAIAGL